MTQYKVARKAAIKAGSKVAAPRWRRRKEARPSEILAAAFDLFVERGFVATRLDEVARRAGVTKGTMYLYFESKEALFKAVVRDSVVPTIARAEQLVEEFQGSTRDLLLASLRSWWATLEGTRLSGMPRLIISEAANFPELARFYREEVVDRAHRLICRVLQRGIDGGEFRPMDVDYTSRVLRAPILFAMVWKHSLLKAEAAAIDPTRYLEAYLDMVLRGVLAAPGSEMPYV